MATQVGTKLVGKVGNMVYYKSADNKYLARSGNGVTAERVKTDPNFENTRRNNREFTLSSKSAQSIRDAIRRCIFNCCAQLKIRSLTLTLMKNIKHDTINPKGERKVNCDFLDLYLHEFEFGDYERFNNCFTRGIDIETINGQHTVTINRHDSNIDVNPPNFATHYSFAAAICMCGQDEFNFLADNALEPIGKYTLNQGTVPKIQLLLTDPAGAQGNFRMFVVAIHFFYMKNGRMMPVLNGRRNAAKVALITN
jgi:hypothetical protein